MNTAESPPSPISAAAISAALPAASRRDWIATWLLVAACWLLIFNQQRLEWTVNPTYGYGWAVPFLALYLFGERWRQRPEARAPSGVTWWWSLPVLALLFYLPVRVVQEANPDWVKANWALTAVALGLSFSAVYALGRWRYVAWFAFPILFTLTALAWPVWLEDYFVQSLTHGNAQVCAELLTLAGQPALAEGNLIQVGHAWVNVEEACSGIRSLQTAFMVSLFFGEFFRLRVFGRAGLLLASFAVAFALNLARTLILTQLTNAGGATLAEHWHDTLGLIAMGLGLAALWVLAELFNRYGGHSAVPPPGARKSGAGRAPFPFGLAVAGVFWLGLSETLTAAWYRYHERNMAPPIAWKLAWPEREPSFHRVELADRTRALLKISEGAAAEWRATDGQRWQMYYLRWEPGRVSKFLSGSHYPTVCLPATGLKLMAETGVFSCTVGALTIPFRTYVFDDHGRDVYVFHAITQDVPTPAGGPMAYRQANTTERLLSCLRGERNLGQRVLGIALTGPLHAEEARQAITAALRDFVQTKAAPAADSS